MNDKIQNKNKEMWVGSSAQVGANAPLFVLLRSSTRIGIQQGG